MPAMKLEHLDYIQIHPTTLYSQKPGRRFLISESVRGEGALLYDKNGQRFDPVNNAYIGLGQKVGNAFQDGKKLK